jgi:hypothetical protein
MKAIKVQGRAKNLKWDKVEEAIEVLQVQDSIYVGEVEEKKEGC